MGTGITAEPHKAMGQDAASQVRLKFLTHVMRQTFSAGIGREGGPKRFEMLGDDLVEDGATRVSRLVSGRYHILTLIRHTAGAVTRVATTTHMCTIS